MRLKSALVLCLLAGLAITVSGLAQEGYPLTGTWYGDWGTGTTNRTHLTMELSWDGKQAHGLVNPGPNSYDVKVLTLDSSKWTVHMEGDGKDDKGMPFHFVADGKIDNLGSYNRTITGTWTVGTTKATFKVRRD